MPRQHNARRYSRRTLNLRALLGFAAGLACARSAPALAQEIGTEAPAVEAIEADSGPPKPAAARPALVHIEATPQHAHVYLERAEGNCLNAVCTGTCEVSVPPGAYRVSAGFRHGNLSASTRRFVLSPGNDAELIVTVEERLLHRWLAVTLVSAGLTLLVSGFVLAATEGTVEDPKYTTTSVALVGGSVPLFAIGFWAGWRSGSPEITVTHRASGSLQK